MTELFAGPTECFLPSTTTIICCSLLISICAMAWKPSLLRYMHRMKSPRTIPPAECTVVTSSTLLYCGMAQAESKDSFFIWETGSNVDEEVPPTGYSGFMGSASRSFRNISFYLFIESSCLRQLRRMNDGFLSVAIVVAGGVWKMGIVKCEENYGKSTKINGIKNCSG